MPQILQEQEEREPYGLELIIDLHECDDSLFTRDAITLFLTDLCDDILDVERCDLHFWDDVGVPLEEQQTEPKRKAQRQYNFCWQVM